MISNLIWNLLLKSTVHRSFTYFVFSKDITAKHPNNTLLTGVWKKRENCSNQENQFLKPVLK